MAEPEEADAVAADGHWSQVAPHEQFTLTLQFDESFQQQTIIARLQRGADGLSRSITPGWKWAAPSKAGDSKYHATKSATKQLQPKKVGQPGGAQKQTYSFGRPKSNISFFWSTNFFFGQPKTIFSCFWSRRDFFERLGGMIVHADYG